MIAATVSLQVLTVLRQATEDCTLLVRCIDGPARLGARFRQVDPHGTVVEFALTKINRYEQVTVAALWPGEGAQVELVGGGRRLQPMDLLIGYEPAPRHVDRSVEDRAVTGRRGRPV
jgi:hypothetical protein